MKSYLKILCVTGAIVLAAATSRAQTAPANDNFADRLILAGSNIEFSGTTFNATMEPGDPAIGRAFVEVDGGISSRTVVGSVWWSWTPTHSGYALISLPPSPNLTPRLISQFVIYPGDIFTNLNFANRVQILDVTVGQAATFRMTAGQPYSFEFVSHAETNLNITFHLATSLTPNILEQPRSQTISAGGAAYFTVHAPDYGTNGNVQWQHNGVNIPGANGPTFQINNATHSNAGEYRALINITDPSAVTISQPATLTVEGIDEASQIELEYVRGTTNQFVLRVLGETNHYYTIAHSTNFVFRDNLLFGASAYDPGQPYLAHGAETPFDAGDTALTFLRATSAGDLAQTCVANLRRLEFGKNLWMTWRRAVTGAAIHQGEINERYVAEETIRCPLGGTYTYGSIGEHAYCDIAAHNPPASE